MTKPFHIFLFILSTILVLFWASLFIPNGQIIAGKLTIRFPVFSTFAQKETIKHKDISKIIELGKVLEKISQHDTLSAKKKLNDTLIYSHTGTNTNLNTDSIKSLIQKIEYPENNDTLLYPFFRELQELETHKKLIQILHYGDSQIEGDRITSYLRSQFQTKFGGIGIGLFPVVAVNPSAIPYNYDISDNWERYSPQDINQKPPHNNYGPLISYSKLKSKNTSDSKTGNTEGWINLKQSNTSDIRAQQFTVCKIYYGFNASPMMVELKQNEKIIDGDILPASKSQNCITWNFTKPEKNLIINFKTDNTADFFGISLTGNSGVIVNNIPLRGSSGLEFTRCNSTFLGNFFTILQAKLIILQFGVNIVPNITTSYDYYENSFLRQLEYLKKTSPGIPILVIGVSDVARNTANGIESYPNIEKIRNAQKNAAFTAGCAFWDMFEAMGGLNSMPSWVNANPPLAQKDYVHLSPAGAKIIGELLYRSFMNDYDSFLNNTKQP